MSRLLTRLLYRPRHRVTAGKTSIRRYDPVSDRRTDYGLAA